MCLSVVWTDEEMEAWLAEQPEVIEVIKVVCDKAVQYSPCCKPEILCYKNGLNIAKNNFQKIGDSHRYWAGFHCWTVADKHYFENRVRQFPSLNPPLDDTPVRLITCLLKKEWITAIGTQYGDLTLVASRAIFPHYPETEARREDIEPFLEKKEAALAAGEKE